MFFWSDLAYNKFLEMIIKDPMIDLDYYVKLFPINNKQSL